MKTTITCSPYVFDDPEKVHSLAVELGGRRYRGGNVTGVIEHWKFPERQDAWSFYATLHALATKRESCIRELITNADEVTVCYEV